MKYDENELKGYPLNIMTIFRFADCTLEIEVHNRKLIVVVIELEKDRLLCKVIWDGLIPLGFLGVSIRVRSSELRRNLGIINDFKEEFPEYFL